MERHEVTPHIPPVYRPGGGPLRWQDDVTEILPGAMLAFLGNDRMTPVQIALVRDYCAYYIDAPCWRTETMETTFAELRTRIKTIVRREELDTWLRDALCVGIDPL